MGKGVERSIRGGLRRGGPAVALMLSGLGACTEGGAPWPEGPFLHPNGDVLAAGSVLDVTDSVPGDVMLAGQSLTFDGRAGGSYLGAGNNQRVRGAIDGSIRAAGGTVEIEAVVGRNLTVAAGTVFVQPRATVDGNAYLGAGSVRLAGVVAGDVYVGGGETVLEGEVGGDVRVESGSLRIGPDARVGGEVRYRLREGATPVVSPSAQIVGGMVPLEPRPARGNGLGFFVFRLLAFVLSALAVVALVPSAAAAATDEMRTRPAAALGVGLLWVVLVPVGVIVLAMTMVGIPLALMLAATFAMSLYLAPLVPGLWLGGVMLRGHDPSKRGGAVLLALAGGLVVAVVMAVPVIGFLVRAVAVCAGLGAFVLALQDRRVSLATHGEGVEAA